MVMNKTAIAFTLVTSLALSAGPASASVGGDGTPSGYTFHAPPANARGVKGLADLRGKPVLIDFWGTR
jgi:hypothetical protein